MAREDLPDARQILSGKWRHAGKWTGPVE